MDKNDIIEYVMHTPHNTNRAVLSSMLNQLAEGGGDSLSDFSTAQVTVNSNSGNRLPALFIDPEQGLEGSCVYNSDYIESPFTVILYKGKAYVQLYEVKSTDGNISYDEQTDFYVITGDCSIEFYAQS